MTGTSELWNTINAANEVFVATYNRGDAAGLAALYTGEGQLLAPNAPLMTGQEDIQGFWQAVMDMGVEKVAIFTGEVEDHGDTAIEVSKFKLLGAGDQELDQVIPRTVITGEHYHGHRQCQHHYIA